MYVPAHFKPDDAEVLGAAGSGRRGEPDHGHDATACWRRCCRWSTTAPKRGRSRAVGRAARARGTEQRPVEGARDRRGDGHRRRARRLHLAGLVRHEAGARSGGPDLELHHRARLRPAGHPRRPGLGRGQRAAPDRAPRAALGPSRGPSTTPRSPTSPASSRRSSASRSSSTASRASGSSARTAPTRTSRARSRASRRPASGTSPPRCATWVAATDRQPLKTRWTSFRPAASASTSSRVE